MSVSHGSCKNHDTGRHLPAKPVGNTNRPAAIHRFHGPMLDSEVDGYSRFPKFEEAGDRCQCIRIRIGTSTREDWIGHETSPGCESPSRRTFVRCGSESVPNLVPRGRSNPIGRNDPHSDTHRMAQRRRIRACPLPQVRSRTQRGSAYQAV